MVTLAAAGGAASVGGIALPGRFDELLRIAVVRRCRRPRASLGAVAFSLFLLGLIDSAALVPLASVAAGVIDVSGAGRAALIVVAVAGVAAAGVVLALPRLVADPAHRRASASSAGCRSTRRRPRDAIAAWAAVAVSWTLRGLALFVLLGALGLRTSFVLALAFLCASSASAVLPIAPAGAVTQAGAGAAILVAAGMHPDEAIAFGVAAQGLVIAAGAVCVAVMAAWHAEGRVRPAVRPVAPRRVRAACEDARRAQGEPARAGVRRLARPRELPLALRRDRQAARRGEDRRLAVRARRGRARLPVPLPPRHGGVADRRLAGRRRCAAPDGERELRRGDVVCFPRGPGGRAPGSRPGHGADAVGAARRSRRSSTRTAARSASSPPRKIFRMADAVDYWEGE